MQVQVRICIGIDASTCTYVGTCVDVGTNAGVGACKGVGEGV